MQGNIIGTRIREKRRELGLTQAQLAELTHSDTYYISRIETGKKQPGRKFLVALSNALNIPTDYFFGTDSNIVLSKEVSELEIKIESLSPTDRDFVLKHITELVDRLSEKK